MLHLIAGQTVSGKIETADVLYLIAAIMAALATVWRAVRAAQSKTIEASADAILLAAAATLALVAFWVL